MNVKYYYDRKYQSLFMKIDDYVCIRLYHDYNISIIAILNKKLNQQYADFFKILKKMKNLIYKLKLFVHWRIHFVFSIIQLKFAFFDENSFHRFRSKQSNSIHVHDDIELIKFWKMNRLINKRQIKRRDSKYFLRWRDWNFEYDEWRNLLELEDVSDLIKDYEDAIRQIKRFSENMRAIDRSIK